MNHRSSPNSDLSRTISKTRNEEDNDLRKKWKQSTEEEIHGAEETSTKETSTKTKISKQSTEETSNL